MVCGTIRFDVVKWAVPFSLFVGPDTSHTNLLLIATNLSSPRATSPVIMSLSVLGEKKHVNGERTLICVSPDFTV